MKRVLLDSNYVTSVTTGYFSNKAIVDYTSPALCTPVTPFPPTGDAAYHQHAGGGPSHGHRQHAQKLGKDRACGSVDIFADRQTDTQTDILITIIIFNYYFLYPSV